MFGGYRNCISEDMLILVCHAILQDDMIKASWKFMDMSFSRLVTILPNLETLGTVVLGICFSL